MALNAGEVYAVLGGRFDPKAFVAFDGAMKRSIGSAEAAEKHFVASQSRTARAARAAARVTALAAAGGLYLFAKGTIDAAKTAAGFEQQLKNFESTTGATRRQMKALSEQALELGASTGLGATRAAEAMTELAKGGLTVKQILDGGLRGALALAAAGEMDLAEAGETVANSLNLFGLTGQQAAHVADALATAANATTADVADFAMALRQGGAAAKAAGLDFDQTVAFLEALAAAGVKGSDAGTSMKAALTQLASPTAEAAEEAERLGLSFFDANGSMRPLPAIAAMLRDRLGGLTRQQRLQAVTTLAGTDGMRALLALYDAGPDKVRRFEAGLARQGSAAEAAAKKNEGAEGAARKLAAQWESAQIIFGRELLPVLADGAEQLTEKLREMAADGSLQDFGRDLADIVESAIEMAPALVEAVDLVADALSSIDLTSGDGLTGEIAEMLDYVLAAIDALRLLVEVADAIPGVDIDMREFDKATADVKALQDDLRHSHINIDFDVDRAGKAEIYRMADELDRLGKRKVAVQITSTAKSAGAAIQAMNAVIRGVPERIVLRILENARSAGSQVAAFNAIARGVPPRKVLQIAQNAPSARAQVVAFTAAANGVPPRRVLTILQNASSARAAVAGLHTAINALPAEKRITIITDQVVRGGGPRLGATHPNARAAGRPAGGRELAVIGEGADAEYRIDSRTGAGYKTAGPQLTELGEDDYVIPLEQRYRGRALGLFAALARDLGIAGYRKGRKPKSKGKGRTPRKVPPRIAEGGVPFEGVERDYQDARSHARDSRRDVRDRGRDVNRAEEALKRAKGARERTAARKELNKARNRLVKAEKVYTRARKLLGDRTREFEAAKRTDDHVKSLQSDLNVLRDRMELADRRDDGAEFERLKGRRQDKLEQLRALLARAKGLARGNSDHARGLAEQLSQLALDAEDNAQAVDEREQRELLTPEQQARLEQLEAGIALAQLTPTLDGPGEDRDLLSQMVAFREQVLAGLQATGAPAPLITDAANDVRDARQELAGLVGVSGTADDDDARAQLAQERRRRETAEANQAISDAALAAWRGFGEIGSGNAAAPTVVVQTLHPGDARTLRAIGDAAAGGIGMQAARRPQRVEVGP